MCRVAGLVAASFGALLLGGASPALAGDHTASPHGSARPERPGLPLRFELNRGQFAEEVRFLARGPGYAVFLTDEGPTVALARSSKGARDTKVGSREDAGPTVVAMRVVGARRVEPVPEAELPGKTNYLVGDRARHRTSVDGYGRARYSGVLPGVDVVYYGTLGRALEYDVVLEPHSDLHAVELSFEGTTSLAITAQGELVLGLAEGAELRQPAPVAHELDAWGGRVSVTVSYERRGPRGVGFRASSRDPSRTLVIDPVLTYSTYLGGGNLDQATAVAVDGAQNAYVVGSTFSSDFPVSSAAGFPFRAGGNDTFVAKLGPSGNELVYATYLGGNGDDYAWDVALDASGNVCVVGQTSSANFPLVNPVQGTKGGLFDAFVSKLNATGSALLFSTYLGGSGNDIAHGVRFDAQSQPHVVGETESLNFPTIAPLQAANGGVADAFVSKLSATGSALIYSTYLGGSQTDAGFGIAVDALGVVVVGRADSGNFPKVAPLQPLPAGGGDAFVSRLNPTGSGLAYSTFLGGSAPDWARRVALDVGGNAVVTGFTASPNFPTRFPVQSAFGGGIDAFVTKIDATGAALAYSSFFGGGGDDDAFDVKLDAAGGALVVGQTSSTDFPLLLPVQAANAGGVDAFISTFAPDGTHFTLSTYLGGGGDDYAYGAAPDVTQPSVYVIGQTASSNFPTQAALAPTLRGVRDGFIAKITLGAPAVPAAGREPLALFAGALFASAWVVRRRQLLPRASSR